MVDLEQDPPPGIACYPKDDSDIAQLEANITGPPDTPYENGSFLVAINVPDKYPFEPPQMRFRTKIYHPNIDENGRICADMLKTGEAGSWKPSLNLSTLLLSIRSLLSSPNPDDPLDADIAREYKLDYPLYVIRAKEHTLRFATGEQHTLNDEDEPLKVYEESQKEEEETALHEYDQQEMSQSKKSRLSLSSKKRRRASSSMSQSSTPDNSQNASTSSITSHTNMNHIASPPPPPPSLPSPSPSSSPSSKSNVSNKTPIPEQRPAPIVFKTINIKPSNDPPNQPSSISERQAENVVNSSMHDDPIVLSSSESTTAAKTKKLTSSALSKQSSSSSQTSKHDENNTQADNCNNKQDKKPFIHHKPAVIVWDDDAIQDDEASVDKKPITLNQTALREISSNIANDDIELISKPTNSKRNKLSLGKSKRRRAKE